MAKTPDAITFVVDLLLSECRQARADGRTQPELIDTGNANLLRRFDAQGLAGHKRKALLKQIADELIARLPAANRSANPELESFFIQTVVEVIDRARERPAGRRK